MRYRPSLIVSAALYLLAAAHPVQAAELHGTIYTGGAPAANLTFTVDGRKDALRTDQRGRYSVELAPGKYVLVIKGQRVEVTVKTEPTKQDIRL